MLRPYCHVAAPGAQVTAAALMWVMAARGATAQSDTMVIDAVRPVMSTDARRSLGAVALAVGLLAATAADSRAAALRLAQAAQPVPTAHAETIRRFVAAIDARRPAEAVAMLGAELVPDESARRGWLRHFAAIRSIHVMRIEPSVPGAAPPCVQYRVTLEAYVTDDPQAPMPYYGWDDNPNLRWIRLCPGAGGTWTIDALATGP